MPTHTKVLGTFSLVMMTVVSVDSVRNLPATALFGSTLPFFFAFATIFFLLPCALVSAELASTVNNQAGVYTWVKAAFGRRAGLMAVWFQWVENIIWYPTILAFVAGTIGYLISPSLAENRLFLLGVILCAFWGMTLLNLMGIKTSSVFSNICATLGVMLPMTLIILLGAMWVLSGQPMQTHMVWRDLLPHLDHGHTWVALTGIILSFCGMEIATTHGADVHNPQRAYPRAMLIAVLTITVTLFCGAWSIAAVLPESQISLVSGIMQAFYAFFIAHHLHWVLPAIAIMLVLGGMGGVNNWIISPTRGLLVAAREGQLPKHLCTENICGAPSALLLYQALIVSVVASLFIFMPSVNGAYWLLTVLAAQLYMVMYLLMFAAAVRLRYRSQPRQSGFTVPGARWGIWAIAGMGSISAFITLLVGFIPPTAITVGGELHYEEVLLSGLILLSAPPFFWMRRRR